MTRQSWLGELGDHAGDRAGAGAELDERLARAQSILATVVRDSQRLLGATLAILVPCVRNLPRKSAKSFIASVEEAAAHRPAAERDVRRPGLARTGSGWDRGPAESS